MTKKSFFTTLVVLLLPGLLSENLLAGNLSSSWIIDQYTKSRLFVGGYDKENKILHLGWQVTLKPGWKTYWRSPGDAGLPPQWTWRNPKNIRSIAVNWPLPEQSRLFDMNTYIYDNEVIFPIDVQIANDKNPFSITLDMTYMICNEICIPEEGRYDLEVSSFENIKIPLYQKAQLDQFIAKVPLKISGKDVVVRSDQNEKNNLLIELPDEFSQVENIFVEGPAGIVFGRATEFKGGTKKIFEVAHNGKTSLAGQVLTLTLLSTEDPGSEMKVTVR